MSEENPPIQTLFRAVAGDRARGALVARDVQLALEEGRWPIVLTERTDHLELLCDLICGVSRMSWSCVAVRAHADGREQRQ